MAIVITGEGLDLQTILSVSRGQTKVTLDPHAKEKIQRARSYVEQLVSQAKPVYGITTGFGKFSDTFISSLQTAELQRNLIISHACGVGQPLPTDAVRALMLLRANSLAKGYSGVKVSTVECLLNMLNERVHPIVPSQGSLGASGDLSPLAHVVLVMLGESGGEAEVDGEVLPASEALARRGLKPIQLCAKEGLALINGTQAMGASLSLALGDGLNAIKACFVTAALTHQALRGITAAYDDKLAQVRPHEGQRVAAKTMRTLLEGSNMVTAPGELRVQDAYSLRCIPQVHGACLQAFLHVAQVAQVEYNSATDNPLVFPEQGEAISGGNFHGEFLALSADYLSIAMSEIGNISERRIERLVNPQLSGLPAFLTRSGGLNSGFMIAQYTAAALVSENKVLSHPASVDSIPSSANQEDHVSMGGMACRKVRQVVENTLRVLGIELVAACQAIDLQSERGLSPATAAAYKLVRAHIAELAEDRVMYPDLNLGYWLLSSGKVQAAVEEITGEFIKLS